MINHNTHILISENRYTTYSNVIVLLQQCLYIFYTNTHITHIIIRYMHLNRREVNCLIRGQINARHVKYFLREMRSTCVYIIRVGRSSVVQNARVRFVPNFTRLSFYRHFGQAPTIRFVAISLFI